MQFTPRDTYDSIDDLFSNQTAYETGLANSDSNLDRLAYVVLQGRAMINYFEDTISAGYEVQELIGKLVDEAVDRYQVEMEDAFHFFVQPNRIVPSIGEDKIRAAMEYDSGVEGFLKTCLASIREYANRMSEYIADRVLGNQWEEMVFAAR